MLKVKVSNRNAKKQYKPLNYNVLCENTNGKMYIKSVGHGLLTNDELLLSRNDDQSIHYSKKVGVLDIVDNDTFTIYPFNNWTTPVESGNIVEYRDADSDSHQTKQYINLVVSKNGHLFVKNFDNVEVENSALWSDEINDYKFFSDRLCTNDYVLFDDIFLKQKTESGFTDSLNIKLDTISLMLNNVVYDFKNAVIPFTNTSLERYASLVVLCKDEENDWNVLSIKGYDGLWRSIVDKYTVNFDTNTLIESCNSVTGLALKNDKIKFFEGFGEVYRKQYYYIINGTIEQYPIKHNGNFDAKWEKYDNLSVLGKWEHDENIFIEKFVQDVLIDGKTDDIYLHSDSFSNVICNNRQILIQYEGENKTKYDEIKNRITNSCVISDDVRFFKSSDNEFKYGTVSQDNTVLYKIDGDFEFEIPLAESFKDGLTSDNVIENNFIQSEKQKNINGIVNYERYPYSPVALTVTGITDMNEYLKESGSTIEGDTYFKPLKKLKFNLNFRERPYTTYSGTTEPDYNTWESSDELFWNNFTYNGTGLTPTGQIITGSTTSDLLGHLGFTDDDVYYQKSALKESFLRLSFYDSPYRNIQKLLFYSTVYFDTNKLHGDFCRDLAELRASGITKESLTNGMIVYTESGITNLLQSKMEVTDIFDNIGSSDGFYIHLYGDTVIGTEVVPLYMKVEFNHAKYGKTVPLILPVDNKTYEPIEAISSGFPYNYVTYVERNNEVVMDGVDMEHLYNDMYIKVYVKYDYPNKKFIWFVPRNYIGDTLELTLFEPRINEVF